MITSFKYNGIKWELNIDTSRGDFYVDEIVSSYTLDVMDNLVNELHEESASEIFESNEETLTRVAYETLSGA